VNLVSYCVVICCCDVLFRSRTSSYIGFRFELLILTSFLASWVGWWVRLFTCHKIWRPPSPLPNAQHWSDYLSYSSYCRWNYRNHLLASARAAFYVHDDLTDFSWRSSLTTVVSRTQHDPLRELIALCTNRIQTVHNEIVRMFNENRQTWVWSTVRCLTQPSWSTFDMWHDFPRCYSESLARWERFFRLVRLSQFARHAVVFVWKSQPSEMKINECMFLFIYMYKYLHADSTENCFIIIYIWIQK